LNALRQLRDLGNTVVLVEHDREVLESCDRLYDFGPGAGRFGGTIVDSGAPRDLARHGESLTGKYLGGREEIPVPARRRTPSVTPEVPNPLRKAGKKSAAAEKAPEP